MRVVLSLTTLPKRLKNNSILPTLESLHNQTRKADAIYLSLPKIAKRLNEPYPVPPKEILALCQIVEIEQDYGPVTKLLGGLYMENDPNTIIISVDDDYLYPETFIEKLIEKHEMSPKSAIGSSGIVIGKFPGYLSYIRNNENARYKHWFGKPLTEAGINVDILYGYSGILYVRNQFPMTKEKIQEEFLSIPLSNKSLYTHDDVYISCYLNSKNVERKIYLMDEVKQSSAENYNALSGETYSFYTKFVKAVKVCNSMGLIKTKVPVPCTETLTGRYVVPILLIIIFLIIIFAISKKK